MFSGAKKETSGVKLVNIVRLVDSGNLHNLYEKPL